MFPRKKKMVKPGISLLVFVCLVTAAVIPVAASWEKESKYFDGWYYANDITLPRNGWWYTIFRRSTNIINGTAVNHPPHKVMSNIQNKQGTFLSDSKEHPTGEWKTHWHYTYRQEYQLRAGFRSTWFNQFTNTINLSWHP